MRAVQNYAERLRYANETIMLIERAQRQERRLQRVYRRMRDRQDSSLAEAIGFSCARQQLGAPLERGQTP